MSRVPHKVLISSLPLESARLTHTCTNSHRGARAYTKPPVFMPAICKLTLQSPRKYTKTHWHVTWLHAYLMHVLRGYILSFKHVSHERTYPHPESLIITHIHKRQTHQQTNYIKRIPTGYIFALLVKIYSIVYDGPAEFIGSSNEFLVLKIYFLPSSTIQSPSSNASS